MPTCGFIKVQPNGLKEKAAKSTQKWDPVSKRMIIIPPRNLVYDLILSELSPTQLYVTWKKKSTINTAILQFYRTDILTNITYTFRSPIVIYDYTQSYTIRIDIPPVSLYFCTLTETCSDVITSNGMIFPPLVWPTLRGNSRNTGLSLFRAAQTNNLKWQSSLYPSSFSIVMSSAITFDGTIYVESGGNLSAIRPNNGSIAWEYNIVYPVPLESSPGIGLDGTIYIGASDRKLYAINPDGTFKWSYETGGFISSSPAIGSDGNIYVMSNDRKLYKFNPSGSKLWNSQTVGESISCPAIGSDGTIYIGSNNGRLYAINPNDGIKVWERNTGDVIGSSPAIGPDGTIYVRGIQTLYAIRPDNGSIAWQYNMGGGSAASSPGVGPDGTIYIGSGDGKLYAINPSNSNTTTEKWTITLSISAIDSSTAIGSDGTIYIGTFEGKLYAINPNNGSTLWEFDTGSTITAAPAISSDGTVYIKAFNGNLYAIGPTVS